MNAKIILTVLITLSVIIGFVLFCMFFPLIGILSFVGFCAFLLIFALVSSRHKTVDEYIASQNAKVRPIMQKIHETIMETGACAGCGLDQTFHIPLYLSNVNTNIVLISVQPVRFPFKGISLRVWRYDEVFVTFAERIKIYKTNDSELYMPYELMDYDLIRDIIIHQTQKHLTV